MKRKIAVGLVAALILVLSGIVAYFLNSSFPIATTDGRFVLYLIAKIVASLALIYVAVYLIVGKFSPTGYATVLSLVALTFQLIPLALRFMLHSASVNVVWSWVLFILFLIFFVIAAFYIAYGNEKALKADQELIGKTIKVQDSETPNNPDGSFKGVDKK